MNWDRPPYRISDDPELVDVEVVHEFLVRSYWARGIPKETVVRGIAHSIPLSVFLGDRQVGFARVVSDHATFAYLADVFVVEDQRGRGLGEWLVATALAHPELQGLRRWLLVTRDAQGLYHKLGFAALADPSMVLTRHDPDVYARQTRDFDRSAPP
jgi:GNAT superfamily N-acetyltransferase